MVRGAGLTAHVTVTDETDYAASFVVVEKRRNADHEPNTRPLILDIAGTDLDATTAAACHPLTGGMILFGRNWQDRAPADRAVRRDQVGAARPADLRRPRRRPRAALSHRRLHASAADARARRAVDDSDADARRRDAATAAGYVLGAELRACGVDFSFTPVLDLDYGDSGVIGDRAFHRDPRVVALLAKSLMHGLLLRRHGATAASTFPATASCRRTRTSTMPVDERSLEGDPGRRRARPTNGSAPRWPA